MHARSLHAAFLDAAGRFAGRTALSDRAGAWKFDEAASRALRTAGVLHASGVTPGDRVVFLLPNAREFVSTHLGVLAAGGVSVPVDHRASSHELQDIIQRTHARLVIAPPSLARSCGPHFPSTKWLTVGRSDGADGNLDLDQAISVAPEALPSNREGGDLAAILFTTGTTGRAKGVTLTHSNTLFTIAGLIRFFGYTPADRELIVLPLAHSFGLGHVYCNLFSGGAVHIEPGLANLKRVLDALDKFAPTGFPGTPAGFGLLLDRARDQFAAVARSLRFIVVNSAALPPSRAAAMRELLPSVNLCVYYGLTEASRSTLLSLTQEGPESYGSVGRPMPGVDISIDDASSEILIRGPHLSPGYWNDEALSNATRVNGWLWTGDKGSLDASGRLVLTGRLKDQINVGGYKVDPTEVELAVAASGLVQDVAVCGIEAGDSSVVVCAVVARAGEAIDERALTDFCSGRLAPYKMPTAWIRVPGIPKTESGKTRRAELADLVANVMAASGAA